MTFKNILGKGILGWTGCLAIGLGMSGCVLSRHAERLDQTPPQAAIAQPPSEKEITAHLASLVSDFGKKVNFDTDSDELKADAKLHLLGIADILAAHPEQKIRAEGFTDSTGTAGYNEKLSQRRALSVETYLVQNGARQGQIETLGRGESQPAAPNTTPEGRAENRRVELDVATPPVG